MRKKPKGVLHMNTKQTIMLLTAINEIYRLSPSKDEGIKTVEKIIRKGEIKNASESIRGAEELTATN